MSSEMSSSSPGSGDPFGSSPPSSKSVMASAPVPQAGRFYRVDSSRLSFTELWRHTRSPLVPIFWLTKLLRIRLPEGSVNDPNVAALRPFVVPDNEVEAIVPHGVRQRMQPVLRELADLGFGAPVYFAINDVFQHACSFHAAMTHRDGRAVARLHVHVEGVQKPRTYLFNEFVSALAGGRFLWSTSARAQAFAPPACQLNWKYGASASQLWLLHRQQLDSVSPAERAAQFVRTRDEMLDLLERHHEVVRDFNLERGIFSAMKGEDLARAEAMERHFEQARSGELRHPEVLAHLERIQKKQTNWASAILVLIVTIGLFVAAGAGKEKWSGEMVLIIVAILLFHEAGHFVAMKVFRYRNVRMFFIPFLGAAVSGQHYTAPGWKKVIVSLMGPLPGILLGGILGIAGLIKGNDLMVKVGMFAVILNGFNLLPVLPLDGGRVMHTILFSRHYSLDIVFRIFAAGALVGIGSLAADKVLLFLGVFMLIGVPAALKIGRIATELRRQGIGSSGTAPAGADTAAPAFQPNIHSAEAPPSSTPGACETVSFSSQGYTASAAVFPDAEDHSIPVPVAEAIIDRVKAAFPRIKGAKQTASLVLQAYEGMTTRPPGIAASIGFVFLHITSFVASLVLLLVLVVAQNPRFWEMYSASAVNPKYLVEPRAIMTYEGRRADRGVSSGPAQPPAGTMPAKHRGYETIVATFSTPDGVRRAFDDLRGQMPSDSSLVLFGQSVFLSLPSSDKSSHARWFGELEGRGEDVFVESGEGSHLAALTLICEASTAAQAEAEVKELSTYFQLPAALRLIPPWAGPRLDKRSEQIRKRHQLARATYHKMQSISVFGEPEMKALREEITRAHRRNDRPEFERLTEQQSNLAFRLRLRAMKRTRDGGEGPVDQELADRYIAIREAQAKERTDRKTSARSSQAVASQPASSPTVMKPGSGVPADEEDDYIDFERILERERVELGPLMGQLPIGPEGRLSSSVRKNCMPCYGYVQLAGPNRLLFTVTFEDVSAGSQALVNWLSERGYRNFKYQLKQNLQSEDYEDE